MLDSISCKSGQGFGAPRVSPQHAPEPWPFHARAVGRGDSLDMPCREWATSARFAPQVLAEEIRHD